MPKFICLDMLIKLQRLQHNWNVILKTSHIYFSSIKIINYKSKVDLVCVKNRSSLAGHSTEICRPLLSVA